MAKALINIYLVCYNTFMFIGWFYLFILSYSTYFKTHKIKTSYSKSIFYLEVLQYGASLEIFHSILKLVRAPLFTTMVQVISRIIIVILLQNYPKYVSINYLLLCFAWPISEIVRYPFYILNSLGRIINNDNLIPYFLLWARYSFFIVLYPIGVSGEILTILFSKQELVKYNTKYININYIIYAIIALYIPGLFILYSHLLKQRKKALYGVKKEKKTQ